MVNRIINPGGGGCEFYNELNPSLGRHELILQSSRGPVAYQSADSTKIHLGEPISPFSALTEAQVKVSNGIMVDSIAITSPKSASKQSGSPQAVAEV